METFTEAARTTLARRLGIHDPDPGNLFHVRLAQALDRTSMAPLEVSTIALMFEVNAELGRQGAYAATARTNHDRLRSRAIVTYRAAGERSATVAEAMADDDDEVYRARLQYRLAEAAVTRCRSLLDVLHAELDVWRTKRADDRAADAFAARTQT